MTYDHDAKTLGEAIDINADQAIHLSKTSISILKKITTSDESEQSRIIEYIDNQYQPLTNKEQALITYSIVIALKLEIQEYLKEQRTNENMVGYI